MLVTNTTIQDYWFGPLHLPAGVGTGTLLVDDTSSTSLYLSDDGVADDGVADDGTGCATGVATAPCSCARAGPMADRLNVATAPSTTAGRKKKCRGII